MLGITKISDAAGDFGLTERPEPSAGPGHVVLRVRAVGICGTDLHIVRSEYKVTPPVTMGHEVCGTVEAVGESVSPELLGQRFVAETFFSTCKRCLHCRNGRPNLCAERQSIGSHVDGAMAARVEVPAANLHPVPEAMSDAAASMAEPVACVTNSLFGEGPYIEPGDDVLIIGPGAIGLIAAQVARSAGANVTVRGTPKDRARLDMAEKLGFAVSLVGDDLKEASFAKSVECSGAGPGFADAIRFLDRRGHLMQMGLSGQSSTLPMDLVCYRELRITSGFASTPASWARAMRLIHAGVLDLERLVSDILPLSGWKDGFDRAFAADGIKFIFDPHTNP